VHISATFRLKHRRHKEHKRESDPNKNGDAMPNGAGKARNEEVKMCCLVKKAITSFVRTEKKGSITFSVGRKKKTIFAS
jgi:hypothetical protein